MSLFSASSLQDVMSMVSSSNRNHLGNNAPLRPKVLEKLNKTIPKLQMATSAPYSLPADKVHLSSDSVAASKMPCSNFPPSYVIRQQFTETYEVKKVLGRGASAEVHLVRHRETGELFACKVINRDNRMNDIVTMTNELEILKTINHRNVIGLQEVFETRETLFLILEQANGGDLIKALGDLPEYTEEAIKPIFYQLLQAIQYLHSQGIVHRDLKLDNILFSKEGDSELVEVKVTDFGLSAVLKNKTSSLSNMKREKELKEMWGTSEYFAPEVYAKAYGRQADTWALGCILYEMLTGELAFPFRETPIGLVERVLFHHGRKPKHLYELKENWKLLSAEAQSLVKSMLRGDPRKRLSIEECLEHPWFNSMKLKCPLKHCSSTESVSSVETTETMDDASVNGSQRTSQTLVAAHRIIHERCERRARRYINLVAEIANRATL